MTTATPQSTPHGGNGQADPHVPPHAMFDCIENNSLLQNGTLTLERAATTDWDVIVMGAGPAGALAARQLSRSRARILLVDKSTFPRSKVCGGCLNVEAIGALRRADLHSLVELPHSLPTRQFEMWCRGRKTVLELPGGSSILRRTFDARLVLEAIASGANFLPNTSAALGDRDASDPLRRVELHASELRHACARGRVIIAANGLNSVSLRESGTLPRRMAKSCRIGLGAVVTTDARNIIPPGTIQMALSQTGYVGLVQASDSQVSIAAAIDHFALKSFPPALIVCRILAENGMLERLQPVIETAEWRGTSALTRSHRSVAVDNVLLLGDAAGYVEPFTGDGMTAALRGALAIDPIVVQYLSCTAVKDHATPIREAATRRLAWDWTSTHRAIVHSAQRRCRFLAALLRRPRVAGAALQLASAFPGLAKPFLRGRSELRAHLSSPREF